ncbi:MAG: DMT family transporter [Alistipes sp.]|nr:DMT family transporter [Alistipes sp.]
MGSLRYNLALILSNILLGVSFSVYVSLLRGALSFEQIFALQLLFSTIVFTPLALSKPNFLRLSLNDFGSIFIVALLVVFGWWYLLIAGASYTNPVDASTITTIGPIFTLITSIIASSRAVRRGEALGMVVAMLGVVVILVDRGRDLIDKGGEGYGNALILCAVVAIAVNTVLITPVLRRHGTVVVMGWYYIIGSLLAMPLLVEVLPQIPHLQLSRLDVAEIGYILLFGSTLPLYLLYVSAEHLTAIHTALYRYIQPIMAATLAVYRGQTTIDRTNIVGAALIFVGMLCVLYFTPRSELATHE